MTQNLFIQVKNYLGSIQSKDFEAVWHRKLFMKS